MPTRIVQTVGPAITDTRYRSCVYQYGPTPPQFAGAVPQVNSYLSTGSFRDTVTNDEFWYFLTCSQGLIVVARIFPYGSVSGIYDGEGLIYQWLVGLPGNSCSPFQMTRGSLGPRPVPSNMLALSV
jgi:hypothetical protein